MRKHSCSQGTHNGKEKMDKCSNISKLGATDHDRRRWRSPDRVISPELGRSGWVSRRRSGWGEDRRIKDSQSKGEGEEGGEERSKRRKEQMIMELESRKCYLLLDPAWVIAIVQLKEPSLCYGGLRGARVPWAITWWGLPSRHSALHPVHMEVCTSDETLTGG